MEGHKSQSGLTPRQRRANSSTVVFRPDGAAELSHRAADQRTFAGADNSLAPPGRKEEDNEPASFHGSAKTAGGSSIPRRAASGRAAPPVATPRRPVGAKTAPAKGAVPFSRFCEKGTVPFAMPDDGERRKRQGNKSRLSWGSGIYGQRPQGCEGRDKENNGIAAPPKSPLIAEVRLEIAIQFIAVAANFFDGQAFRL